MTTITPTDTVKFHFGLYVTDLERTVRFYAALLGQEPAKHYPDYAKFEMADPPMVLSFLPSTPGAGNSLNHVGLRLQSSEAIVEVQRRLEMAGYPTRREDGVECCYAKQTKFWVTDPDGVLWETYTLHEDIDHHGAGSAPVGNSIPAAGAGQPLPEKVWVHSLNDPFPDRLPFADGSLEEVRLEGTMNDARAEENLERWVKEACRVVKPGGRVMLRGMVSDATFPGKPDFPGVAGKVKRVPREDEPEAAMLRAGLTGLQIDRLKEIDCLKVPGVGLWSKVVWGWLPVRVKQPTRTVRYDGPFERLTADDGTVFLKGKAVTVSEELAERLRTPMLADQFTFEPAVAQARG